MIEKFPVFTSKTRQSQKFHQIVSTIAHYFMHGYKTIDTTDIAWRIFGVTCVGGIVIAFFFGRKLSKAALANSVKRLKTE